MKEIKRNQFVTNGKENEPKSFHVCDKNTQKSVGIRFLMFQPNWMQTNENEMSFFHREKVKLNQFLSNERQWGHETL